MAIPAHVRMVFGGSLPGGERFSWSFDQDPGVAHTQATLDGALSTTVAAFTAHVNGFKAMINAASKYDSADAYFYPAGASAATLRSHGDLNAGGTGPTDHPNQVALCITKLTALSGRQHRGRLFLPLNGLTLGSDGQVSNANLTGLLTAIGAVVNAGLSGIVISRVGAGFTAITGLRVDSRPDVIRGRSKSQAINERDSIAF